MIKYLFIWLEKDSDIELFPGQLEVYLKQKGHTVNDADANGKTLLMVASARGHVPTIQLLLENGAQLNQRNKKNVTALGYALAHRKKEAIKFLISKGAKIGDPRSFGKDPVKAANCLIECGMPFRAVVRHFLFYKDRTKSHPIDDLMIHLMEGDLKAFPQALDTYLEAEGHTIDDENSMGTTLLIMASVINNRSIIQLLIDKGADLKHCNHMGMTPLMVANAPKTRALIYSGNAAPKINIEPEKKPEPSPAAVKKMDIRSYGRAYSGLTK